MNWSMHMSWVRIEIRPMDLKPSPNNSWAGWDFWIQNRHLVLWVGPESGSSHEMMYWNADTQDILIWVQLFSPHVQRKIKIFFRLNTLIVKECNYLHFLNILSYIKYSFVSTFDTRIVCLHACFTLSRNF